MLAVVRGNAATIKDLEQELEIAKHNKDIARIELLEKEREAVLAEIHSARGLGKSERMSLSTEETARVTVTMAIKAATKKIGSYDPDLSLYLTQTIATGKFCKYTPSPDGPQSWSF